MRFEDLGVSGFRGLNANEGALSVFLEAVKLGKIEKGSYLLVESLDRLSRETTDVALTRFMEIISNGITIVTLFDGAEYSSDTLRNSPHMLLISIVGMIRANEESETKSKRLSAAWDNKRKLISQKRLTSICPAWLKYNNNSMEFEVDESKADIVRTIFQMCSTTTGASGITKHLNKNKTPVFGRAKSWGRSYILKIIHNRSVLGEFQPHKVAGKKRQAIGDPIKNYYPAIIDESLFLSAEAAITRRKQSTRGRKGASFGNVFTGLVYCKHCGEKMQYRDRGNTSKGGQYLVCRTNIDGNQCASPEWRIDDVEALIFKHLREVDLGSLVNKDNSRLEFINEKIALNEQIISNANENIERAMSVLIKSKLSEVMQDKFTLEIQKEEAVVFSKSEEIKLLVVEKSELIDSVKIDSPDGLKNFIAKYKENTNNYEFRSGINELLRKTIMKIELFQRDASIDPTSYNNKSAEVVTYRQRSAKVKNMKLDDILIRPSFNEHCKWMSREIFIKYKYGDSRYISFGDNLSFIVKDISQRFNKQ